MTRKAQWVVRFSVLATAVAVAAVVTKAPAGPPVCPQIYAPVICDNGKVYPNQCVADRHHAKNCVPYGI